MKIKNKIFIWIIVFIFFISCTTSKHIEELEDNKNTEFQAESDLLNLPYYSPFFYYPESTIRSQRKLASDKFTPYDILNYLKPKTETEKLLEDNFLDPELFKSIPSNLDVIASTIHDLQRGDTQKAIEKNKNILNNLERNRTKTLNEDYGVSPFREASLILAIAYLQEGDENQAIQILEKLVTYSNTWSPIYMVLGDYYYNKKAYSLSLSVATKGIDKCNEKLSYLYVLQIKSFRGVGDIISAKQSLNRALVLFPKNGDIELWNGIIDYDQKDYDSACKHFNAAYELNFMNPYIAHNYSYCLIKSNQYDLANEVLMKAITNSPSQAHLYFLNGVLENLRYNFYAAQKSWQTYLSLTDDTDPNYKTVIFKLSQMELNEKDSTEELVYPSSSSPK